MEHLKAIDPQQPTKIAGTNSKATISIISDKMQATSHSFWSCQLAKVQKAIINSKRPADSTNQTKNTMQNLQLYLQELISLEEESDENKHPKKAKGSKANKAEYNPIQNDYDKDSIEKRGYSVSSSKL